MTGVGLATRIDVSVPQAQGLIDQYFTKLPNIKLELFDHTKAMLLKDGYIRTITGRYWHLSDQQREMFKRVLADSKRWPDPWMHPGMAKALRQAANCRIQGPTSDLVLLSMIKFEKAARKKGWIRPEMIKFASVDPSMAYLLNEVHDSLAVETRKDMAEEVGVTLKECMESPEPPFKMPIPWIADLKSGMTMGTLA